MRPKLLATTVCLAFAVPCLANETITYSYDAQGRLVKVVHTGTTNNGQTVTYTLDKLGNRTNVTATGASR